jgi:hypothetical protein
MSIGKAAGPEENIRVLGDIKFILEVSFNYNNCYT